MDRNTEADDNGEYFYRYLKTEQPHINAYFILDKSSYDWNRLREEGFKLLEFSSHEHMLALNGCEKIISSHIDNYITKELNGYSLKNKEIIFLQHGVIKDDLSKWLNSKERIDLFITSTKPEYESICHNNSKYKFTKKEVQLTGMPRHDFLLKKAKNTIAKNQIIIQPTWRYKLVGEIIFGNKRKLNPKIIYSEYTLKWKSLLNNKEFYNLCSKYGYSVVFMLHPNMEQYYDFFEVPKNITVVNRQKSSMQDIFCASKLMITDYSSVAFEMAYLKKKVIYYQFDNIFVNSDHIYQVGYFNYNKNGFGPVCSEEKELLLAIEQSLIQNCIPEEHYLQNMDIFPYKDTLCCERIYEKLLTI